MFHRQPPTPIPVPDVQQRLQLFDRVPLRESTSVRQAMEAAPMLQRAFLSGANVTILQNAIRHGVFMRSNQQYLLDNQRTEDLLDIMRGVYNECAQLDVEPRQEIMRLNQMVIDHCVHQVYEEAKSHLLFLEDIYTIKTPLDLPVLVNCKDKQLEYKGWSHYQGMEIPKHHL